MQGTKEIKRRIKSVKSTKKITKAMELVAASKMKRAVASTLASRLYAEYSWEILTSISENVDEITHPLFIGSAESPSRSAPADQSILLLLITSNRGLCGAYNAQVIKKTLTLLKQGKENIDFITVGKKGDIAMRRIGKKVIATFAELPTNITLGDVVPVSKLALEEFSRGKYDRVLVAYSDFRSAMVQTPNIKQIIPVSKADLKELIDSNLTDLAVRPPSGEKKIEYLIEGDKNRLLGSLAEKLVRMQLYQMLLESNASEQSSRMVAMKNASDAAGEMIDDLTLVFNKARQANITQEISEISAGMASVA